jgi:uncharacterized protein (TIGR02217 family)
MAHFSDLRLPEDLEVGAVYGPEYVTAIAPTQSGRETRNRVRDALCRGDLSFAPRLAENYDELLKFFRACNGKFNSFRFKDYGDFACAITEGVVRGIDTTHFQLQKKYAALSHYDLRDIQQPIATGFVLKDGSTTLTLTTDYTLDSATGIVTTVATHTASALTWSGEFDNAVRFDVDKMATSFKAYQVHQWGEISIAEVIL